MASTTVYIVGSKGIPAKYGGFETFVDKLVTNRQAEIDYIVTGMSDGDDVYDYNGARCVQFKTKNSVISRMLHTAKALRYVLRDAGHKTSKKDLYILGCRAGIFLPFFRPFLKHAGVRILANPDGAEWKRAKWGFVAKRIVMLYEILLIKFSDVVVCDAISILELIHIDFKVPKDKMTFIAYGAEVYDEPKKLVPTLQASYESWLNTHNLKDCQYYLMVGRFVPENNYELVIREFMASNTASDLIIISNVEENQFYEDLLLSTRFNEDQRIKFVGTVYDQGLLKVIRSHARAYIHGHEVGGTNPSLLEALGSTNVNLIYDVSFNKEVAGEAALYFNTKRGDLAHLINQANVLSVSKREKLGAAAKERIRSEYAWGKIVKEYEELFTRF